MPGSAYSDPPTFVPNQTLTASQLNAVGDSLDALKWWSAGGSMPYAYDDDQLEELLKPARAALLMHNATIPSWLTLAAAGADANKNVRVNAAGTAFELGAGGIVVASKTNNTGHSYTSSTIRDMPNSSGTITPLVTSTIVVIGAVSSYGTGTYGARLFWLNVGGTELGSDNGGGGIADFGAGESYQISERVTSPLIGIKTGVAGGSPVTIKIREKSPLSGYQVENLQWIAIAIPS